MKKTKERLMFALALLLIASTVALAEEKNPLVASDGEKGDSFGVSVAVSHSDGNTVVVGAENARGGKEGKAGAGAAYVFVKQKDSWEQAAKLVASDGEVGDLFGCSVFIADNFVVVGAANAEGRKGDKVLTKAGAAYVFVKQKEVWKQVAKLTAGNPEENARFGKSVSNILTTGEEGLIHAVVIGAPGAKGGKGAKVPNAGLAYVFVAKDDMKYKFAEDGYPLHSGTPNRLWFGDQSASADSTIDR